MVEFNSFVLRNGLQVLVYPTLNTQISTVSITYQVGSRDEEDDKTGLAHLFEHFMFGSAKNYKNYDQALYKIGGESNAYTTTDVTSYYVTIPTLNLAYGLWLEAERMQNLNFDSTFLEVQKKVVIEEYREYYVSRPYGDAFIHLSELSYQKHPYKWPVIGCIKHIKQITLQDMQNFFKKFYHPTNAVMVIATTQPISKVKNLCSKYFELIERGRKNSSKLLQEPLQQAPRVKKVSNIVPHEALFMSYHTPPRNHFMYKVLYIIIEMLAGENTSSRFFKNLIHTKKIFSSLEMYLTESFDSGLCIIEGKLNRGIALDLAKNALVEEINILKQGRIEDEELMRVKNQIERDYLIRKLDDLYCLEYLAKGVLLDNINLIQEELPNLLRVSRKDIIQVMHQVFHSNNSNTIFYTKSKNSRV